MCSASKNLYSSRRTYSDTPVELVEVCVGMTRFGHANLLLQLQNKLQCIEAAKEPSTKQTKSNTDPNMSKAQCRKITVRILDDSNIFPTL